jgi:hypothetical protein
MSDFFEDMACPELMSTRLEKKEMYTAADLTGISKKCDIFIFDQYSISLTNFTTAHPPRYIFISTYSPNGLFYFLHSILPTLTSPIVLILASEDITFPKGDMDVRFDHYGYKQNQPLITRMIEHPMITKLYVENLDTLHPKLIPIPLGIHPVSDSTFMGLYKDLQLKLTFTTPRSDRILCVHRIHEDGTTQWNDRRRVNVYCSTVWAPYVRFFHYLDNVGFRDSLLASKFVLCVHGGGLDPAPRIWQALLCGCIPIIKHSTLDEAYSRFPVIYVDDWDAEAISKEKMLEWEKFYDTVNTIKTRKLVLGMLTLEYWWNIISGKTSQASPNDASEMCLNESISLVPKSKKKKISFSLHVINLERRQDRWSALTDHLKQFSDITVKRHEGSDAQKYPDLFYLSPREKGGLHCCISHKELLEILSKTEDSVHFIAEDDLVIKDWDYIKVCMDEFKNSEYDICNFGFNPTWMPIFKASNANLKEVESGFCLCTHLYAIKSSAIHKFVAAIEYTSSQMLCGKTIFTHSLDHCWTFPEFKIRLCVPSRVNSVEDMPAIQSNSQSDINVL